jgi:hypothetical protein
MVTFGVRRIVVATLVLSSLARPASASDGPPSIRRIRVLAPCFSTLLDEATAASATVRALVTRIEQSNLIVYVRCVAFNHAQFVGRFVFLTTIGGQRYVVIELKNPEPWQAQVATMAHELQHAVEIATAPWVHNQATMAQYYRQAGMTVGTKPLTFDTDAARAVGLRVQRELAALRAARQVTRADAAQGGGSR